MTGFGEEASKRCLSGGRKGANEQKDTTHETNGNPLERHSRRERRSDDDEVDVLLSNNLQFRI